MRGQAAPSKYHAQPTTADGIRFASAKEARRYAELRLLERAGQIQKLVVHPAFPLRVCGVGGGLVNLGHYVADFQYWEGPEMIVEDVKGMSTLPLARWKQKHLKAEYGITVVEIR